MKLGLSHQRPDNLIPEHLLCLKQMGVEAIEVRMPAADYSLEYLIAVK